MFEPWILEEIRRQEEEEARRQLERPQLEIVEDIRPLPPPREKDGKDECERGVVVLDLGAYA